MPSPRPQARARFTPSPRRRPARQTIGGLRRPYRPPPPPQADPSQDAAGERRLLAAILTRALADAGVVPGGLASPEGSVSALRAEAAAWLRSEACGWICAWLGLAHDRLLMYLDACEHTAD